MVNMLFLHGVLFLACFHGIQSLKICSFNVRSFGKSKIAKEGIVDLLVKSLKICSFNVRSFGKSKIAKKGIVDLLVKSLKICSFNVRSFGKSKIAKEGILDLLVKIISRCDLLLMMEIKDSRNQAFPTLMQGLNNQGNRNEYESIISERLGRMSYKEQYAFIYRHKLLSVKRSYQYPDRQAGDEDVFAREPFVVWFSSRYTTVKDFVIIPQHTMPNSAVREIDELYDVYLEMKRRWRAKNFILMGDFNADCDYVRKKQWKNIRLRNDTNFIWLVGDKNDTTVKESTHCAYDRIVLHGEKLIKAVVPNSVNIFNFKEAYGLTERQALNVSDHFPVEVDLQASYGFLSWLKSFKGLKG